ncbi:hypothetical protein EH223_11960 [candidate division KSB1 bacterium]|nr:PD40 domain-containing protein [candidate division KSB1 bacterium]RQW02711.1 MAG: hypothetical protein EH223_11960 [candidate division KSB1 bacterium]
MKIKKHFVLVLGMLIHLSCTFTIPDYGTVSQQPTIDPDYRDILLPPNIAPLNFIIKEEGEAYKVIFSADQKRIEVNSRNGTIQIPIKKWRKFLKAASGASCTLDIFVKKGRNHWEKYKTITNRVASQPIDSHVVFRLINPGYVLWWDLGIYQRDLTTFRQSAVLSNRLTKQNCMNCHAFCLNNPNSMMLHMRAQLGGTMLIQNGEIKKMNTGTPYTMSAGVYPAWHPGGKHIAFSVNKIFQNFHAHADKSTYVYDTASDLVIYDIEKNQITTSPKVSTKRLENLPTWDPNGKDLYFISAPEFVNNSGYDTIRYDLMRTTYDINTNEWGKVRPVLTAEATGQSITFPKVSPKGRFLMFTMSEHGYFTIYTRSSDLWLYDLTQNHYRKLEVNSDDVDSYHSWSSDGKWFVFASKRKDGLCARLYFSYLDEQGHASKPFLLPQKNPRYYETYLLNYNVPELITGPVRAGHWDIAQRAYLDPTPAAFDSTVQVDALSGATRIKPDESRPYL